MHTHANTYVCTHPISRTFFFSGSDDLYTCVCEFFHGSVHYTPPPHQQGWSRGTQDGMSVKAWEREERSWACSHRPDSWLHTHNKDPCTGAWHPGGRSRHTHKHTHTNTYSNTCAIRQSHTLAQTVYIHQNIGLSCSRLEQKNALSFKIKAQKCCHLKKAYFCHQRGSTQINTLHVVLIIFKTFVLTQQER